MILLNCQNLLSDYILWLFSLILVDICACAPLHFMALFPFGVTLVGCKKNSDIWGLTSDGCSFGLINTY